MEKIKKYQQIIAALLREYASSNTPGMEDQVLLDFENNHFQLVTGATAIAILNTSAPFKIQEVLR